MRDKTNEEVKTLIENMCQDEYRSSNRGMKAKSFIAVDTHTTLLIQLEALTKHLATSQPTQANVNQIKIFRCIFCGEWRTNDICLTSMENVIVLFLMFTHVKI